MSFVLTSSRAPGVLSAPTVIAACPAFEVRRQDIDWRVIRPGALEIEISIRNPSNRLTPPTRATVRSAVFGAFLQQHPLTALNVPPIAPRGRVTLTAVVPTRALASPTLADAVERIGNEMKRLSEPGRPVSRLQWQTFESSAMSMLDLIRERTAERARRVREAREWRARSEPLAPAPLPPPQVERWTGNLHVFVAQVEAERHQAHGVVVRRGVTTQVPFEVGDLRPDAYRFRLDGDASGWEPSLSGIMARGPSDVPDDGEVPFARGRLTDAGHEWVETSWALLRLAVRPPESAVPGRSELHVQRRSTGQTTVVEFELDPR